MLQDTFGISNVDMGDETSPISSLGGPNNEASQFFKLLEDANKELYPGCSKFTKLTFIVRLYHIKCLSGWSNKSLDLLLALLKEAFPEGETLPESFYELKKVVKDLGLDYKKIDACPNDCMLYWKEAAHDEICKICGVSRWKQMQKNLGATTSSEVKEKKIPVKVLRHFPLVPRLQRLFMSSKTASLMVWHDQDRVKDGFLRHPANSVAWKDFDAKHMSFSSERRNVRLGLATDGFNPFGTMSVSHSTWPIILTVYNLPPWMCMKQPNLILSLLIPGPRGPGNDIDVYLQPLIDELKNLWEFGVGTYDAHTNQSFEMKAALLWTLSDFPGYAMLSGWSTKGRFACPYCNKDTCSQYLKNSRKFCYMGHRQFLDSNHEFRSDRKFFNGIEEFKVMPNPPSATQILKQLEGFQSEFGKGNSNMVSKRRRQEPKDSKNYYNWKKKSIFFDLPY
ncbi:uncharacterized protein LOC120271498 isoform X2 [Dioscorea cayenensis subsp. rotundata]|nr:uncharacterized protein LOC120271498 isoform X2 [Dioscorea cayenensis subsp. rotundata]